MNIKDIISVSGVAGLSKLTASRNNGLLLEDLDSGKTKFYSLRKHQFTPLETVAIYTMSDTEELKSILQNMHDKKEDLPIPPHNSQYSDLAEYFEIILPEYDKDRVYTSDIKKIIKWYNKLQEKGLIDAPDPEEKASEEEAETEEEVSDEKE